MEKVENYQYPKKNWKYVDLMSPKTKEVVILEGGILNNLRVINFWEEKWRWWGHEIFDKKCRESLNDHRFRGKVYQWWGHRILYINMRGDANFYKFGTSLPKKLVATKDIDIYNQKNYGNWILMY